MPTEARTEIIREYILRNVSSDPHIGLAVAKKFKISRAGVSYHMSRLVKEGWLEATGSTRNRTFKRKAKAEDVSEIQLTTGIAEDIIWKLRFLPMLESHEKNIIDICQYGFTEIFNNCIDHSASEAALVAISVYYDEIIIFIGDDGIGIFEKIKTFFNLADHRHALLELTKGKLTSDKAKHSGEGIFFTSRMFNKFEIMSGNLFYSREKQTDDEWLIETDDVVEPTKGTSVTMHISTSANWSTREVFEQYQEPGRISFRKTHVPLKLGKYPGEQLVSRSQAKRIITRFGDFSEIILDFSGIDQIGQPFADEIFRVFVSNSPAVRLVDIRASPDVKKMIEHVQRGAEMVALKSIKVKTVDENTETSFFTLGLLRLKKDG